MTNKKLTAAERFAAMGERLKKDGRLQIDAAKLELSEQIFQVMEDKGITEAELARRLDTSRAYVNKVLQGSTNFTIESLVKIGIALECELKLEFVADEKADSLFDDDIIYIEVEEPINEPRVVQSPLSFNKLNVFDLADFRESKTVKVVADQIKKHSIVEIENAAVQIAA